MLASTARRSNFWLLNPNQSAICDTFPDAFASVASMPGERFKSATYSPASEDAFLRQAAGLWARLSGGRVLSISEQRRPDLLGCQHAAECRHVVDVAVGGVLLRPVL